nr:hypothetical protein [Kibdelosporangium sp. MJ126-NF4]
MEFGFQPRLFVPALVALCWLRTSQFSSSQPGSGLGFLPQPGQGVIEPPELSGRLRTLGRWLLDRF